MYHMMIVTGSAMMYRMRLVKLQSRKKLPMKPATNDSELSATAQVGSENGKPSSSEPSEFRSPFQSHC